MIVWLAEKSTYPLPGHIVCCRANRRISVYCLTKWSER